MRRLRSTLMRSASAMDSSTNSANMPISWPFSVQALSGKVPLSASRLTTVKPSKVLQAMLNSRADGLPRIHRLSVTAMVTTQCSSATLSMNR